MKLVVFSAGDPDYPVVIVADKIVRFQEYNPPSRMRHSAAATIIWTVNDDGGIYVNESLTEVIAKLSD